MVDGLYGLNLSLDPLCLARYVKSPQQQARCLSENWAEQNLYCPNCLQPRVRRAKASTKVFDFTCPSCFQTFNVKASMTPFGRIVRDAEYSTFMTAINTNANPNLVLVHYDKPLLKVVDVEVIPRFFFTPSSVLPTKPTKPHSRKNPWQGCNIALDMIPTDGHVAIVNKGQVLDQQSVKKNFTKAVGMLNKKSVERRGWITDVLRCIRDLNKPSFSLPDVYAYRKELGALHPKNRFVDEKIRQQLQELRRHGIVRFHGRGKYALLQQW